jgi:hypothetical protein
MEPPMDCEKYKTSKIMYKENISWIYLIIGKYFWVLRVRFYFIRPYDFLNLYGRSCPYNPPYNPGHDTL